MKDIDTKRPRRLDLEAPLLSTRRSHITSITSLELSRASSLRGSSDGVPFSWEHSPGKPKYPITTRKNVVDANKVLPLPKPPLIRWQQNELKLTSHDGFEGDISDNNDNDSSFSNAVDLFSLAGSLNTSERLDVESEMNGNGALSPNFMIQRFLPAATALAASSLSALAANKDGHSSDSYGKSCIDKKNYMAVYSSTTNRFREASCVPRVAGEAYSSSKGCGLQIFFPWRTKARLCGVKSPVKRVRSSLKSQVSPRYK